MEQSLSEFVGEIYETIHKPDNWHNVIVLLCRMMNAKAAGVYIHDKLSDEYRILASYGLNPAVRDSYDVGLGHYDYGYQVMQTKPLGKGTHLLSFDDVKDLQPKYVQLLLKPNDAHYVAGLGIIKNDKYFIGIKLIRGESQAPFEDHKLDLLTQLHPHFERVIRIYWHYRNLISENFQLKSSLSKVSLGVLIISKHMEVTYCNPIANRIITNHGALDTQNGLKAYYDKEHQQLKKSIECLLSSSSDESARAQAMGLHHPNKSVPLILILAPCEKVSSSGNKTEHADCLTIYISDPESSINIKEEALCQVHGLTMTEANIAILVANGMTLKEISELNQTSLGTVRTQIKQIFNKTGVTRQQDLIKLLVSGAYNLNVAE